MANKKQNVAKSINGLLFSNQGDKSEEVNFKKDFCEKYFDKGTWSLDVLKQVDVLLQDKKGRYLLYIESKHHIRNKAQRREAIAQVILTNKKQDAILNRVAIIYLNNDEDEILELIDCSDDSVMYNNDINWAAEKPSSPTKDAIDRINDRVKGRVKQFTNEEIKEFYDNFKKNNDTTINITEKNFSVVYNLWKNEVRFKENIEDEQDRINLFLVDLLNGTKYRKSVITNVVDRNLFDEVKIGEREVETDEQLIREGTNLSNYVMMKNGEIIDGIKYSGVHHSYYYTIANAEEYHSFWNRYKRPPEKHEFMNILERSSKLYSEKYRRDTGGEYTPTCFVELQNKILLQHYDINDYIVCDPCAGVGNLENQFGKDFKQYCYLSTLEQMDVDTCKIKGFENAIQFDFLKDDKQPKWKYKGRVLPVEEIAKLENRKLMIVMNPPYQRKKGLKYDMAIEFFIKVLNLHPDVIVYYCKTEFFMRSNVVSVFKNSGYHVVSHVFSNAKDTFKISEWPISLVIFDKFQGEAVLVDKFSADRYELNKHNLLEYKNTYSYDNSRPNLINEIENEIWKNNEGLVLGQWCYLRNVMYVSNGGKEKTSKITSNNLKWCLLSKGINFNSHDKYFERSYATFRGTVEEIPQELIGDAIMFSLFYKQFGFSNKEGHRNYIMPFTAEELGCAKNDLNVLFPEMGDLFDESPQLMPFDFRDFMRQFDFSEEAQALYKSALEVFRYYHRNNEYPDKDYNDSYYDITNAIMGRDVSSYTILDKEKDTRVTKVKITNGKGFGRSTIAYAISSNDLPLFIKFFDARDVLARKINKQLVEQNLLLWERENIY